MTTNLSEQKFREIFRGNYESTKVTFHTKIGVLHKVALHAPLHKTAAYPEWGEAKEKTAKIWDG
jgi:hypothetical protein